MCYFLWFDHLYRASMIEISRFVWILRHFPYWIVSSLRWHLVLKTGPHNIAVWFLYTKFELVAYVAVWIFPLYSKVRL